jgi:tetratricopeptide (TPR) repeat protein
MPHMRHAPIIFMIPIFLMVIIAPINGKVLASNESSWIYDYMNGSLKDPQIEPGSREMYAIMLTNLGSITQELGLYNDSISYYKKALAIEHHRHISALVGLGSVLSPENITYFKRAVAVPIYTKSMIKWEQKAIAYRHLKQFNLALSTIDDVLKTTKDLELRFYALGIKATTLLINTSQSCILSFYIHNIEY